MFRILAIDEWLLENCVSSPCHFAPLSPLRLRAEFMRDNSVLAPPWNATLNHPLSSFLGAATYFDISSPPLPVRVFRSKTSRSTNSGFNNTEFNQRQSNSRKRSSRFIPHSAPPPHLNVLYQFLLSQCCLAMFT